MEKELSRVPRLLSESYNSGLIERLYDSGGSVMLDIIIYLCGNHISDLFGESWFSIEDFCNKMGYNRTNLQKRFLWGGLFPPRLYPYRYNEVSVFQKDPSAVP